MKSLSYLLIVFCCFNHVYALFTIIDTVKYTGTSLSMSIGRDGLPVMVYYDHVNGGLKFVKCGNLTCSNNMRVTLSQNQTADAQASIAIGSDGFPIISYWRTGQNLTVIKCGDNSCQSGNSSTPISSAAGPSKIVIGLDGLPVIGYWNNSLNSINLIKCGNMNCTSVISQYAVGSGVTVPSVEITSNGYPILSYMCRTNRVPTRVYSVVVTKCGDSTCADGALITRAVIDSISQGGHPSSMVINRNGIPIISYFDAGSTIMKMAICNSNNCLTGYNTIILSLSRSSPPSFIIGNSDIPIISYCDDDRSRQLLLKCGNSTCSSGNTIDTIDGGCSTFQSATTMGYYSAITIGSDQIPIIGYSYYNGDDYIIKLFKCSDSTCSISPVPILFNINNKNMDIKNIKMIKYKNRGYILNGKKYFDFKK